MIEKEKAGSAAGREPAQECFPAVNYTMAKPDLGAARAFLKRLDPGAERFTFQTFADRGDAPAQVRHSSLDFLAASLGRTNQGGAGVFVTVNETDLSGRKAENIKRVRAVFADLDGSPLAAVYQCKLEPSMVVETSPGRFHAYWLVEGLPLNQFEGVQRAIAARFDADKSCIDLPRVLRLPGFIHQKAEPFQVRIIHDSAAPPYSAGAISKEFPPIESNGTSRHTRQAEIESNDPVLKALNEQGLVIAKRSDAGYNIRCPFEFQHTTKSTESSTVYFPQYTGGYKSARIVCQHAHCAGRSFEDYEWKLGLIPPPDSDFFSDLEKTGVTGVTGVTLLKNNGKSGYTSENSGVTGVTEPKIPAESERPCYRVFDEAIEIGKQKFRAGVWYFWAHVGKGEDATVTLQHKWVCSPLYMEAVTRDGQDNNFGRLLKFKNTLLKWREWPLPMEMLKGSGEDLRGELLSMGVHIDPKSKNELNNYLQSRTPQRRILAALQVGWSGDKFVLPDCVFGPGKDGVIFQSGERNRDEHAVCGTLDGWRSGVAGMAAGNPLLMLGLSAAFAGPLLAKCHAEGGGFHFVGDSSTGKTTIIDAACSVWGGKNYKRSWRATANGIEGAAVLFSDCLLALDEISECDPREIGKIVYSLGNGYGKQRASRSGAAREVARWLCFVLSSGERSIETAMLEGGQRSKAGQEIRLLTVSASGTFGAWDDLKGFPNGAALSDAIKAASAKDYGHAGREFLERLTHDKRDFSEFFEKIKTYLCAGGDLGGQDKRAAARFAVVALAGELASEYGITGWDEGGAIEAAQVGFKSWRDTRQSGNNELHKMIECLSDYIDRYGDGRFTALDYDDEKMRLLDRSGYWETDNATGARQFLFNSAGLKQALAGFDYKRALKALSACGVLPEPDEKGRVSRVKKAGLRSVRLYPVSIEPKAGI